MNILEGIKNNVLGTSKLVEKSIQYNVKNFILISSDKAGRPTNYRTTKELLKFYVFQKL